jgi:hypothetical protein
MRGIFRFDSGVLTGDASFVRCCGAHAMSAIIYSFVLEYMSSRLNFRSIDMVLRNGSSPLLSSEAPLTIK